MHPSFQKSLNKNPHYDKMVGNLVQIWVWLFSVRNQLTL